LISARNIQFLIQKCAVTASESVVYGCCLSSNIMANIFQKGFALNDKHCPTLLQLSGSQEIGGPCPALLCHSVCDCLPPHFISSLWYL